MFFEMFKLVTSFAVDVVCSKYSVQLDNPIFYDVVDMVVQDLMKRNGDLFTEPFLSQLASIDDLPFGDKEDFVVSKGVIE